MPTPYDRFVALHAPGDPLVIYNCWDPGSAVAIAKAGVKAIATGSYGAAESLGYADGEKVPLDLVFDNAKRIMSVVDVPVSIDFEGGYSIGCEGISSNMARLAQTGAVGCNFEDSIIGGVGTYPMGIQAERVAAAREGAGDSFFINARIDLYLCTASDTPPADLLDETVDRAAAYISAGADGIFVPGLRDVALIAALVKRTAAPLNVSPSPGVTVASLADAGVARVSYGTGPWREAMTGTTERARSAVNWR